MASDHNNPERNPAQ